MRKRNQRRKLGWLVRALFILLLSFQMTACWGDSDTGTSSIEESEEDGEKENPDIDKE